MKKDLAYYQNLPYKIEIRKHSQADGGGYGAFMPEFDKVAIFWGDGETEIEALQDLKLAFNAAVETMIECGENIPEPISDNEVKRINITMPQGLINAIDKVTTNRSAWLSELARRALAL